MDRGLAETNNKLSTVDSQIPTEATVIKDVMKFIPHEDNWEREYFDNLRSQRNKRRAKKIKQINKWNKSNSPKKGK